MLSAEKLLVTQLQPLASLELGVRPAPGRTMWRMVALEEVGRDLDPGPPVETEDDPGGVPRGTPHLAASSTLVEELDEPVRGGLIEKQLVPGAVWPRANVASRRSIDRILQPCGRDLVVWVWRCARRCVRRRGPESLPRACGQTSPDRLRVWRGSSGARGRVR